MSETNSDKTWRLAEIGRRLREQRRRRGWTRRELARQSGVSERFLAEIEGGRGNPSVGRLLDLAAGLGCAPAALLPDAGVPLPRRQVIALLGLRGAGKSTIGRALAGALGHAFVELDALIEAGAGMRLGEMFEIHGQAWFRRMERQALQSVLAARDPVVLSTGGGLVSEPETFAMLRAQAHTVWLKARPVDHWDRVVAQGDMRPMQGHDEAFAHLCAILAEREPLYRLAELTVDTSQSSVSEVCEGLAAHFAGR